MTDAAQGAASIEDVTPRPTQWTTGLIIQKELPTATTVRLRLHVEDRQRHRPGQHYLLRLRAPDGYTAQRSYSLASDDSDPLLEMLVEKLPGGEVSEFLADVAEVGDVLELRGPMGRWFTWDVRTPALCVVGGTGVVPAVAMSRAARNAHAQDRLRIVAVGRTHQALPYVEELARYGATLAFTREDRPLDPADVQPLLEGREVFYVCGSSRFAEYAEGLLMGLGVAADRIRVEQFGATG